MATPAIAVTLPLVSVSQADLQAQLVAILTSNFSDWTDNQASNNMIMLLEIISAVQELDYGYINRKAREAFIQYALDYRNVAAHARALRYYPSYQTPAVVSGVINSVAPVTATTVIPAGTPFRCTLSGVLYQTVANVSITTGQTQSAVVQFQQCVSQVDTYAGTGVANQSVTLNQTPVIPTSVVVVVDAVTWSLVDNFVDSLPTDTVYTFTMDQNGYYTLQFGNGVTGANVPLSATVSVNYNTGGGSANAIGPNGLGTCAGTVLDAGNSAPLSLSAYNTLAAVPGGDVETTAQIAARAPISAQSPLCLLTKSDVQNAVNALPGVYTCLAVNWQDIPALPQYLLQVYVVPIGFGAPSPDLVTAITNLLTVDKPLVLGSLPSVVAPTYDTIDFNIQVGVLQGFNQNTVQNSVTALLTSMFANTDPSAYLGFVPAFGMSIYTSLLSTLIQLLPGVKYNNVLSPSNTVLTPDQFPLLGTIAFTAPD